MLSNRKLQIVKQTLQVLSKPPRSAVQIFSLQNKQNEPVIEEINSE